MNNNCKKDSKVLIVSFRYFGDALLCTSLAERIKEVSPSTKASFLCYSRIAPILKNNKSIDSLITVEEGAPFVSQLSSICGHICEFDLAVITQLSSRAVVLGRLLAKETVGFEPGMNKRNWWKKYLFSYTVTENNNNQPQILKFNELLDVVGFPRAKFIRIGLPSEELPKKVRIKKPYIVIHPTPQKIDRRIPMEKWGELIEYFSAQGYAIVVTGSGLPAELSYINEILSTVKGETYNLAGKLSWGQTANVIKGAKCYIGIDTGTTHLAAATAIPTFAIFGPTPVTGWGPWGVGQTEPYESFTGIAIQKRGNVTVLGYRPFYYCNNGCERCISSQLSAKCFSKVDVKVLIELIEEELKKEER